MTKSFTPLIEQASKNDSFKHQTHENIAKSLSNLLINNKGKGQTIGLEGAWGTGKSTIIAILKNKLPKEFTYFYFDAWAHEGDPLRRVFLESLIDNINQGNDKDLNNLKEKISNRKKIIRTKTSQQATLFGKLLSVSLLLVPLGAAIVSTIDFSIITFVKGNRVSWELILGTICTLAPLLIVLFNLIKLRFSKTLSVRDGKNWSFLEKESDTDVTQEISEDEEKSSIEFERYFQNIIELSINRQSNQQLVIAIDNLDRIDAKDSLKIWSTLQTFLKQRNPDSRQNDINKNIWIIVPYDAIGLAKLWELPNKNEKEIKNHDDTSCTDSFFDKCFQIRLEVPKPILSDWEDFTSQMIDIAFGKSFDLKENILKVLRVTRNNITDSLTPREIKTFVNQVGINWLNCDKSIPIESVAYYVILRYLNKVKVFELQQKIVSGEIPNSTLKKALPKTITEDLAGLSFGVSSEIGQQLLLEPELIEKLTHYEEGKLEELVNIHENGFWFVFKYHLERVTNEEVFKYSNSINQGLWKNYSTQCFSFTNKLNNEVINLDTFNDIENHEGFIQIFNKSDISLSSYWYSVTHKIKSDFHKNKLEKIENIFGLLSYIIQNVSHKDLKKVRLVTENLDVWKNWSKNNFEYNLELYNWFIPEKKYFDVLSAEIKPGAKIPEFVLQTAKYFFEAYVEKWSTMIEACKQHIIWNSGSEASQGHSIEAIDILYALCFNNELHLAEITAILKNGMLYNYLFHQKNRNVRIDLVALLIGKYFPTEVHNLAINAVGNSVNGYELVKKFWSTPQDNDLSLFTQEFSGANEIIWDLAKDSNNLLIGSYIIQCTNTNEKDLFNSPNALLNYRNSVALNKDIEEFDEEKLGLMFIEHSSLKTELEEITKEEMIDYAGELSSLVNNLEDVSSLSENLKKLVSSDWQVGFIDDTYITSLALEISQIDKSFKLENNYYDALLDYAKSQIAKLENISDWQKENWSKLILLMSSDFQQQFKNNLTIAYSQNLNLESIESLRFNAEFIDLTSVCENNLIAIQSEIESSIKSEDRTTVLQNIIFIIKDVKLRFESSFKTVIKEPLNTKWNETANSDFKEALEFLAKKIGVKLIENNEE